MRANRQIPQYILYSMNLSSSAICLGKRLSSMLDHMMGSGGGGSPGVWIFSSINFCRRWFEIFVINELDEGVYGVSARLQLKIVSWRSIDNCFPWKFVPANFCVLFFNEVSNNCPNDYLMWRFVFLIPNLLGSGLRQVVGCLWSSGPLPCWQGCPCWYCCCCCWQKVGQSKNKLPFSLTQWSLW